MRGLIYKEFYLGRKTYLAFFALTVLFTILGILVCVSMICGNLQEAVAKDHSMKAYYAEIFTYVPYLLFLCSVTGSNQSIFRDYEAKWMTYSYTLPTEGKVAVGVRYLAGLIIMAAGFLYGLVNAGIISVLTEIPVTTEVVKNMVVILLAACVCYAWMVPLAMKYKTANAVAVRVILVGAVFYAIFVVMMIYIELQGEEVANRFYDSLFHIGTYTGVRDGVFLFSPLLMIAVLGFSYYISVRVYQRREK